MNLFLGVGITGLAGLVLGTVVYGVAAITLIRLRRTGRGDPIPGFAPPVSIIKPLAGLDEGLEENLETFYALDYGEYEIVYSFAREDDPACAVARRVADRHPAIRSTFVVDGREPGGNSKVNRLTAGVRHARRRLILFSDGNVRVRPDFLSRAVSWFLDPRVGVVSHLFRGHGALERRVPRRIPLLERLPDAGDGLRLGGAPPPVRRREVDPGVARRPGRDRRDRRSARLPRRGLRAWPTGPARRLSRGPVDGHPRYPRGEQARGGRVQAPSALGRDAPTTRPLSLLGRDARERAALVPGGDGGAVRRTSWGGWSAARRAVDDGDPALPAVGTTHLLA